MESPQGCVDCSCMDMNLTQRLTRKEAEMATKRCDNECLTSTEGSGQ